MMKKWHEHIKAAAQKCGLSYVVVDSIIKAYIDDLRDSMFAGNSVKIDRLVTIHITPNEQGGYKTSSAVSKTLRLALREGSDVSAAETEDTAVTNADWSFDNTETAEEVGESL